MAKFKAYNATQLSRKLREFAALPHTTDEDDNILDKGEALALSLWNHALGWKENKERRVNGEMIIEEVIHPPAAWAMQVVYDRLEGRTPQSIPDEGGKRTAAKVVRELAVNRLNAKVKVPKKSGPPVMPPRVKKNA